MKKSIIAGAGVMTLAAAAMPFAGVFAVDRVDTITANVSNACNLTSGSAEGTAAFGDVTPGGAATTASSAAFTVTCNVAWTATPKVTTTLSQWSGEVGTSEASNTIVPGTATSGAASNWSLQVAAADTTNGYSAHKGIDSTTTITSAVASTTQITPTYRLYVSPTQQPGSYTGKVTFTIATNS